MTVPNVKAAQMVKAAVAKLDASRPADEDLAVGVASYGILTQTNPEYDAKLIRELEDLYKGGYAVMRRADYYLPQLVGEGEARHKERCALATYQPYFGQIVDQFVADVFEKQFSVTPQADAQNPATPGEDTTDDFYTEFAKNCDRKGLPFEHLMQHALRTALVHRRAVVVIDAPSADSELANRAEEEAAGLDVYAYECPVEQLIDWEQGEDGNLEFAIIRVCECRRSGPLGKRGRITEKFTVWTDDGGVVRWDRYEISYEPDQPPKSEDMCQRVAGGVAAGFDTIPVCIFRLPEGLWVGNKIGPQSLEHFRRRSSLIGSENRSLCAIPYVGLGSELGAPGGVLPSGAQQDETRGRDPVGHFRRQGYLVLGADDKVGFAEPSGACYALVHDQLKELRDDMFAVNHQMAASVRPTTTALGRSGLSKQQDQDATTRVLSALGQHVSEFGTKVYDRVSAARDDDIKWAGHGLDDYHSYDRESVLEEATSLDLVQIPSPTFRKKHKFEVAKRLLPSATPQELDVIRDEIEQGVESEEEMRDLEDEAKSAKTQAVIDNPAPPVPMGPKPPKPSVAKTGKKNGAPSAGPPGA